MVNIPGLRDIELETLVGTMPIHIMAYEIPEGQENEPHTDANKNYLFNFEVFFFRCLWVCFDPLSVVF